MQCVVLAGGLGTRMSRFTSDIPKALIPVNGIPFLEIQLQQFELSGIQNVTLCIGYKGEMIEEYIAARPHSGLNVSCFYDGDQLLGTGGALRALLNKEVLEDVFILTYGDSYLTCDYKKIYSSFNRKKYDSLMVVQANHAGYEKSNVAIENGEVSLYSKIKRTDEMHWIDYGLSILKSSVIADLVPKSGSYDLGILFETLSTMGRLEAHVVQDRYYEVGSEIGLRELEAFLNNEDSH